jgi:hypothetical protein
MKSTIQALAAQVGALSVANVQQSQTTTPTMAADQAPSKVPAFATTVPPAAWLQTVSPPEFPEDRRYASAILKAFKTLFWVNAQHFVDYDDPGGIA